jgi:putative PIN family toxin of toxin-antitoxin system
VSKIVLDTSVVIAAFAARGLCESVFELCLEKHDLITSNFLFNELREKLKKKLKLPESITEEILETYRRSSQEVIPASVELDLCRDPDDIPVIGTCISGEAEFLVSGDKDLLVLKSVGSTLILSPREFYELQK